MSVISVCDGEKVAVYTDFFLRNNTTLLQSLKTLLETASVLAFCDTTSDLPALRAFFGASLSVAVYDVQTSTRRESLQALYTKHCCEINQEYQKHKVTSVSFARTDTCLSQHQLNYCAADVYATYQIYVKQRSDGVSTATRA